MQPNRNLASLLLRLTKILVYMRQILLFIILFCVCSLAHAQVKPEYRPTLSGTLRGKYEYQTSEGEGRFEVRTARVSVSGNVTARVLYKAEIDLCDEGEIKMLDAYTELRPWSRFNFIIGQMRVPFTIDAHRSPHRQYFANRSFIAKQVGNVRDVGAMAGYAFGGEIPIKIEAGLFNGSGLTGQKDYWTKGVNFSAKAVASLPIGLDIELSAQKVKPDSYMVMMYDVGTTLHVGHFLAEAEYLYKTYAKNSFKDVHAVDAFVNYDFPIRQKQSMIRKVSALGRYDFMTDHSDGRRYVDNALNEAGRLIVNDWQRHRLTGGLTISLATPFVADIRINYEKYFYRHGAVPKVSEKDKIVVEFMTHF